MPIFSSTKCTADSDKAMAMTLDGGRHSNVPAIEIGKTVSCSESITRRISSKLRPVLAG